MTKFFILFLVAIPVFTSCVFKDLTRKNVVTALIDKYPLLSNEGKTTYQLNKTLTLNDKGIQIQLFLPKNVDYYEYFNQIIVLKNSIQEEYAIPIFSNNFRKYWNFENEPKSYHDKQFNSLFEKEFISAINKLNLNDSKRTSTTIFLTILNNLLGAETITEYDGEKLDETIREMNSYELPAESDEDCLKRSQQNFKQILKGMKKAEYSISYNAHLDKTNYRIYQFDYDLYNHSKLEKLNMLVYRQDCVFHFIEL